MALFGYGKEKNGSGSSEQVLAYIEDAQRVRVPFRLVDGRGTEFTAILIGLSTEGALATFQVQGFPPADKGAKITATFILDGLRVGGTFRVVSTRSGQVDLALPEELGIVERRKKPRAKLNPREGATLTALTGIFEGLGMTGIIENLSESGARIRVERAMEIKGERKQALHTSLIQPGHAFGILRLSKLPKIPGAWECSGQGVYLEGGSAALFLGVAFNSFPSEALNALRSVIGSRVGALPSTLPTKTRRNQEPELTREAASAPKPPAAVTAPVPATPAAALAPEPQPAPEPPDESPEAAEPLAPVRNTALLRLKKRSRTVVVVATPENAHHYFVASHLTDEGYGKVLVAQTLKDLLDLLADAQPNLLFIEDGVAELQGLDLVEALRRVSEDLPAIVLAQEEISTATVLAARRAGVSNLMVKPYDLDDAFSVILESALGIG